MMKPTPLIPVHSAHGCTGHLLRTAKGFRAFEVGAGRFSRVRTMRGLRSMACSIAATGLLVKEFDDALSASRYAIMMRRYGQSTIGRASFNRQIQYPNWGLA